MGVDSEAELSLLPPVLEKFVTAHPGVEVSVRSGDTATLLPALLRRELHFLVADAELAQRRNDLDIRALAAQPIAVALRPEHPLARKRSPASGDAASYPMVGASTAPRFERWKDERGRLEIGEAYAPSLLCDNYEVLKRLAERSDAIVFGPRDLLLSYQLAGRLKIMPWPLDGPDIQPSLIRSREQVLSPAVEHLFQLFES